jgi:competence protein ComEC
VIDTPKACITFDYLLDNNIENLHWIMISHSHFDHSNGIIDLVKQLSNNGRSVERIYYNLDSLIIKTANERLDNNRYLLLLRQIKSLIDGGLIRNPGMLAITGTHIIPVDGVEFQILHPSLEDIGSAITANNVNHASVVVRICYEKNSILFTGDLSENGWELLLKRNSKLGADILKFPHHGSWFKTVPDLLKKISPQYVILSCGETSEVQYGLPSKKTIEFLTEQGVDCYVTKNSHQEFIIDAETIRHEDRVQIL